MKLNSSYKILAAASPGDRQEWHAVCKSFNDMDVYFFPEYSHLCELNGDGKAFCFVYYGSHANMVMYPFLVRPINELRPINKLKSSLVDITSPYGYGGYLRSSDRVNMDDFYATFKQYCLENDVISEFVRFHPILNNISYRPNEVTAQFCNETVAIDLTKDKTRILVDMAHNCQKNIRTAKKHGTVILEDSDFRYLDDFYNIYTNTMQRVHAQDYYFFPRKWFDDMVSLLGENLFLFHAIYQDSIIASLLLLHAWPFLHFHLGGSIYEMQHLRPNNLLHYQVSLWAKTRGFRSYHLGGGLQPNDNLFKFKASFSPVRMHFYIGKIIHNPELYRYLTSQRMAMEGNNSVVRDYFPEYRTPMHA